MSDFLSNFSKDKYAGKKLDEVAKEHEAEQADSEAPEEPQTVSATSRSIFDEIPSSEDQPTVAETPAKEPSLADEISQQAAQQPTTKPKKPKKEKAAPVSRFQQEETEFDPGYKKRQRRKWAAIIGGSLLAVGLIIFAWYQLTHVKVPNFVDGQISEARTWGTEEGVKIEVKQENDFDIAVNKVISQKVAAGKKIKKGDTLNLVVSLGPDGDEVLALPDFKTMDFKAAEAWVKEKKAENATLTEQFNDEVAAGQYIKHEFVNPELKDDTYRRKDRVMIYYSKGKQVFEENIDVPDFTGKTLADVTTWTKEKDVSLKVERVFSDTIAKDGIVSQEKPKDTKIAQKSEFKVQVSNGKGLKVPNYADYSYTEAESLQGKVPAVIKKVFSADVPYGGFISQSVAAGTQYGETDELPLVQVVYSEGQPYLKDLRGSATEGDLARIIYEDYNSKGAAITYETYAVNSAQPKGTVVEMSQFGTFIPLNAHLVIGISLGNLQSETPAAATPSGGEELPSGTESSHS